MIKDFVENRRRSTGRLCLHHRQAVTNLVRPPQAFCTKDPGLREDAPDSAKFSAPQAAEPHDTEVPDSIRRVRVFRKVVLPLVQSPSQNRGGGSTTAILVRTQQATQIMQLATALGCPSICMWNRSTSRIVWCMVESLGCLCGIDRAACRFFVPPAVHDGPLSLLLTSEFRRNDLRRSFSYRVRSNNSSPVRPRYSALWTDHLCDAILRNSMNLVCGEFNSAEKST